MARRALIVGINDYQNITSLQGCVPDATLMASALANNDDGSPNYHCKVLKGESGQPPVTRKLLRENIEELFSGFDGDALFYFSGHGAPSAVGGYLATHDAERNDLGLPMNELLTLANGSKTRSVLMILDCCHSGLLGNAPGVQGAGSLENAVLREGITILAASKPDQVAVEIDGQGLFTELMVAALKGGSADVRGRVSAASIYAYVEQALGAWDQRPMYKSHANKLEPVRQCTPGVPDELLREIPIFFPEADHEYPMDPRYEETNRSAASELVAIFKKFKKLQNHGLLKSRSGDDLYWTCERSGNVFLTPLGQFYWRLAKSSLI